MKRIALLLVLLAASGCASKKIAGVLPDDRAHLFPYGTYRQHVTISVPAQAGAGEYAGKRFEFGGAVQLKPDLIRVVMLSPFGTTVAKIEENRVTGQIKTEIYAGALKKHEARVTSYYSTLKSVMLASAQPGADPNQRWTRTDARGRPLEIETRGLEHDVRFKLEGYDDHGIPERMTIEPLRDGPRVQVEVTGYEIL